MEAASQKIRHSNGVFPVRFPERDRSIGAKAAGSGSRLSVAIWIVDLSRRLALVAHGFMQLSSSRRRRSANAQFLSLSAVPSRHGFYNAS
jgi:hypothetical protein